MSGPRDGVPVTDVPVAGAPTDGVPVADIPVADIPVADIPVADVSTNGVPANGAAANGVPVTDVSTNDVPANGVPANGAPANGVPVTEVSTNDVPANGAPANGVPVTEVSTNGAPTNGAPNGAPANGAAVTGVPVTGLGWLPVDVVAAGTSTGRPAYVYDLTTLRTRCADVGALPIPRKRVFFASMANDHPQVIACIKDAGHGVFVNSRKHLQIARRAGMPPDRVLYASSNMVDEEMRTCANLGVRVVLDSVAQIHRFGLAAGPGYEIGLRVSVGFVDEDGLRDDPGYRFGVSPAELPAAVAAAREHGLRIGGVHSYFGTNLTAAPLVDGIGRLTDAAAVLPDLTFVDAGGGFGVAMPGRPTFDFDTYTSGVGAHLDRLERRVGRTVEFLLEPGRYLAASCGHFFVTVVDVKERADRVFVGTNGSVAVFPRPLMYPDRAEHPVGILGRDPLEPPDHRPVYVCGSSTYSQDFLARGIGLPLPRVGDTLVFGHAGAYCRSMLSRFLGKDEPAEIVLDHRPAAAARTGVGVLAERA